MKFLIMYIMSYTISQETILLEMNVKQVNFLVKHLTYVSDFHIKLIEKVKIGDSNFSIHFPPLTIQISHLPFVYFSFFFF